MPSQGSGDGIWGTLVWQQPQTSPAFRHAHGYITTRQLGEFLFVQVESPAVDILPHEIRLFPLPAICFIEVLPSEDDARRALALEATYLDVRLAHRMSQEREFLLRPTA